MDNSDLLDHLHKNDLSDDSDHTDRSWFDRTFSALKKDSLRGGIFTMLLTALGTGMFTLHHVYNDIGIFWTILFLFVLAVNFIFSMRMQTRAAVAVKDQCKSLNDLVKHYLGSRFLIFYNTIFFIYNILALISLLLAITKTFYFNFEATIWTILNKIWTISAEKQKYAFFNFYAVWVVGFFMFFLNVQKSVDSLRYFSLMSFFIFVGIILVCVFQCSGYYEKNHENNTFNFWDFSLVKFLNVFGLPVYSFNCVTNFYGIYTSIRHPSEQRLNKIFLRTFMVLFCLFVAYGLSSYYSLGTNFADATDLFIFRPKIRPEDSDLVMTIFRALLVVSLFIGYALNVSPLKLMTFDVLGIGFNNRNNLLVSLFYTIAPVFTAAFFTEITKYANLAGCFTAILIAFVVPGLLGVKIEYFKQNWQKLALIYWILLMTLLALIGTYIAVKNF